MFLFATVKPFQVFLPLHGQQVSLLVVALLADGCHIAFSGLASSNDGNDVVHGQFLGRKVATAVMAGTPGQPLFPPLRLTQSSGFISLPSDFFIAYTDYERFRHIDIKNYGS
jgi:hypothetical protein